MGTSLRSPFAGGFRLRLAALACMAGLPVAVALGGDCPQGRSGEAAAWWWEDASAEAVAACFADEAAINPPVEAGADPDTPLFQAARYSTDPAVVRALLAAGAAISPPVAGVDSTVGDDTALHVAARYNDNPAVVAELVAARDSPQGWDEEGNSPLHYAAAFNPNPSVAGALVEAGASVDVEDRSERATPLHHALRSNRNPAVALMLIGAGADVDARNGDRVGGDTPLHYAARYGAPLAVVAALVEAGAEVNARNRRGSRPADRTLDDDEERLAATGETPLHHAARYNASPDAVRALVEVGADVGATGGEWLGTPLHDAAQYNANPAVVEALVEAGADVNARNRPISRVWRNRDHMNGVTPLHRAASGNLNPAVVEALLGAGAEVDARDTDGATPLHYAAGQGWNPDVVRVLAAAGADVDTEVGYPTGSMGRDLPPDYGNTPLQIAVRFNTSPAVVEALVEAGAALGTEEDVRPGAWARQEGREAVAAMLEAVWAERGLVLSRDARRRVQWGLEAAGYGPGGADGVMGGATRRAIRRWQEARGAPVTGYLDADAAQELQASGRAREERRRAEVQGRKFRDCPECPEMVVVPAGSYMMGSPPSEAGRDGDEGPRHRVAIGRPFAVGVYEVTRGEYGRFVSEEGYSGGGSCRTSEGGEAEVRSGRSWRNPGAPQTDAHPAVCVGWEDAKAYVEWLSQETGEAYRLLSEAEWEYVARAGTGTARYWGEGERGRRSQCRYANGADRAAKRHNSGWTTADCDDGHARTAPVGSFSPNGFGVHDVLGNASEWVEDCVNESYAGAPPDGSAWTSGECVRRVLRGGSWYHSPGDLRSALRLWDTIGVPDDDYGFRVARPAPPEGATGGAGGE